MNALAPIERAAAEPLVVLDLEQQVLGGLLAHPKAWERVEAFLRPHHFGDPRHGIIFQAIADMRAAELPATPTTLAAMMSANETLAKIGGPSYLARVVTSVVAVAFTEDYARVVLDLAVRRSAIAVMEEASARLRRGDVSDQASKALGECSRTLDELAEIGTVPATTGIGAAAMDAIQAADDIATHGIVPQLVPSGFADLDELIDGFDPGSMIVIGARPSAGKTSLAQWMAYNAAKAGHGVAFFSIEMTQRRLTERWLSGLTGIPANNIKAGRVSQADLSRLTAAQEELRQLPIVLDLSTRPSMADIAASIRKMRRDGHKIELVIIDYLGLMKPIEQTRTLFEATTAISGEIKAAAKTLNLPIVVLSQLSRANEGRDDKRPTLSDLRQSGAIEQDADMVMFLHREHYYLMRQEPRQNSGEDDGTFSGRKGSWEDDCAKAKGKAEVNIAKNRNGPIGLVDLSFTDHTTRFGNLAREDGR